MGELEHGTYNDECADLTEDEVYTYFGFNKNGEESSDGLELESDEELAELEGEHEDAIELSEYPVSEDETDTHVEFGTEVRF